MVIYRSSYSLGSIYIKLDKSKTSIIGITQKIFKAAESYGYIGRIGVTTKSIGEDAYVEQLNDQGVKVGEPIDQLKVSINEPTEDFISFVESNKDIMHLIIR